MVLSTKTDYLFQKYQIPDALRIFSEAGFDALDYSLFDMENDDSPLNSCDIEKHGMMLLHCANEYGLAFNQAHAPCWHSGNHEFNTKLQGRIERAVMLAGILGAKCIVVHPIAVPGGGEKQKEINKEFYRRLEPIALAYRVKVALENMWDYGPYPHIVPNVCSFGRDLVDYYETLQNPSAFTVCLDLGHSGLVGDKAEDAVHVIGHDRLGALHVHDNNLIEDAHTIPYDYDCKSDWNAIMEALADIDYQGDFTFEADRFLTRFDNAFLPIAVRFMAQLGRYMTEKIDNIRKYRSLNNRNHSE